MKSHISATIDKNLLERVDRYRKSVKRSRSQVIEIAIERLLIAEAGEADELVVSEGSYQGKFSRGDTYER